jgi:hypothetical protein
MSDIRWEDPPAGAPYKGKWRDKLLPLMEHPKRWAILHTTAERKPADSLATNLRTGKAMLPPGRWEFETHTVEGEHRVYARYLGPDDEDDS